MAKTGKGTRKCPSCGATNSTAQKKCVNCMEKLPRLGTDSYRPAIFSEEFKLKFKLEVDSIKQNHSGE